MTKALANIGLAALICGLLAVAATVTVPPLFGLKPVNIVAGSMTGTYDFGTLVIVDPKVTPTVGSVITWKNGERTPVTHRVVAIQPDPSGNNIEYITKGDFNKTDDPQPVPPAHVVGVVTASVPYAGLALGLLDKTPVLVFLGTLALGLYYVSSRSASTPAAKPARDLDPTAV